MKNALLGSLITLCLFLGSCNSDFNINAPHQDVYVLNCILRSDTSIQYALISKNYFTENGTVPPPNSIEQNLKGADIRIYYNNSVFVMRDTTIQLVDSGNVTQIDCYYVNNLILSPGKVVSVEASVPAGDTLKSTVQVPQIAYSNFSQNFPQLKTSPSAPDYSTMPNYSWSWIGSTTILCLPQLEVYYKHYEQGTYVDKEILIPLAFYFNFDRNGNPLPVNVGLSFRTTCVTPLETVNKAMQDISGNDPHKEKYTITKAQFSVVSLDPESSKYYSAYNTYAESFTIKLRPTDFSDIQGGKGIFGVCYKFSKPLVVDSLYIQSFGYRYDPL
jgi:hypothetical protein